MRKIITIFLMIFFLVSQSQETQQLTIEQAYQFAKENSINLKTAQLDLDNASFKIKETRAIGLPQVNGEIGYNYFIKQPVSILPARILNPNAGENETAAVVFGTQQSASAGATLSQLIFNGSYLVGLQSAKAYQKIAELAYEKTDIAIKEAVFLTYSSVLVIDENLTIIDKNIKITEKNKHDIEQIYKVGLGEEQPVDQMEYSLTSLKSTKKSLGRNRINLINALKFLIGKKDSESIELSSKLEELLELSENKLIDESLFTNWENHIDVKMAENNLRTKELMLKFEKSKALPSLAGFISSTYNGFSNEFDFIGRKWFNATTAGLSLNIPIFSGFDRKYKAAQAKVEIERANLQLQNTKERLTKDAKELYNSYQNSLEELEVAKKLQTLANKIFKTQQIKYYEGIGTSFDLIQSETQKYSSDNAYFQAVFAVIQNKIKLDKALNQL